jgi:hypothetical protein
MRSAAVLGCSAAGSDCFAAAGLLGAAGVLAVPAADFFTAPPAAFFAVPAAGFLTAPVAGFPAAASGFSAPSDAAGRRVDAVPDRAARGRGAGVGWSGWASTRSTLSAM